MLRALRAVLIVSVVIGVLGVSAPARAQAAPGPFVKQAFDLLMDRFVSPPSSATLLNGGWAGGLDFLKGAAGAAATGDAPSFSGDRGADWDAFLSAYPRLVTAGGPSLDQHALDFAVVRGMTKALDSPYTFVSAAGPPAGQAYGGIGFQVSADLFVIDIFPGTPAEAAGLRIGDRVIAVDGASVEGMKSDEMSTRVRGPVGSTVQVTVRRGSQPDPMDFTMARAEITAPWVTSRVLDGGVGLLRLSTFPAPDALDKFDAAVARLESANIKALVIDVRGNMGGFWTTSDKVVSRFVREGQIRKCTPRQGQPYTSRTDGSAWGRNVPIAIVVNDRSASGSETLAATLREGGIGYLVGTRTAGQYGGASRSPLADGSTLQFATQDCTSGQGQEIEHVGLEPDQTVELDPAALAQGQDAQLEAALAYLRAKAGQ